MDAITEEDRIRDHRLPMDLEQRYMQERTRDSTRLGQIAMLPAEQNSRAYQIHRTTTLQKLYGHPSLRQQGSEDTLDTNVPGAEVQLRKSGTTSTLIGPLPKENQQTGAPSTLTRHGALNGRNGRRTCRLILPTHTHTSTFFGMTEALGQ